MKLKELSQSREEIMEISKRQTLNSQQMLLLKSRSFAIPIGLAGMLKGKEEYDKGPVFRNAYNLMRELDTIEDSTLPAEKKNELIDGFNYIVSEISRGGREALGKIRQSCNLSCLTRELLKGCVDEEEKIFVEHFGRGPVLEELCGFDRDLRQNTEYSVTRMGNGMKNFLRADIKTESDLETYCFYAAGGISGLLNGAIYLRDGVKLSDSEGERVGEFLQSINITKNVREDWNYGRIFIPQEYHESLSHEELMNGDSEKVKKAREEVRDKMIGFIERNKDPTISYVRSIPKKLQGYRAFCLAPYIAGIETLELLKSANPEDIFKGNKSAISIPRDNMKNIGMFVYNSSKVNPEKVNAWLEDYSGNPEVYDFSSHKFKKWL